MAAQVAPVRVSREGVRLQITALFWTCILLDPKNSASNPEALKVQKDWLMVSH